jgi:hypothetical protein
MKQRNQPCLWRGLRNTTKCLNEYNRHADTYMNLGPLESETAFLTTTSRYSLWPSTKSTKCSLGTQYFQTTHKCHYSQSITNGKNSNLQGHWSGKIFLSFLSDCTPTMWHMRRYSSLQTFTSHPAPSVFNILVTSYKIILNRYEINVSVLHTFRSRWHSKVNTLFFFF